MEIDARKVSNRSGGSVQSFRTAKKLELESLGSVHFLVARSILDGSTFFVAQSEVDQSAILQLNPKAMGIF